MKPSDPVEQNPPPDTRRRSRLPWLLVMLLALLLLAAGLRIFQLMQAEREAAVVLTPAEQLVLEEKLARLRGGGVAEPAVRGEAPTAEDAELEPVIYTEDPERRRIQFTERELNAAIARDPALAGRAAVRLSPGQVSTSLLVDVPEGLPLLGGRRLRVQAGLQLAMQGDRVQARLLGVSVGGVPLPNAWLGGLKGADLLADSGLGGLGAGIEAVEVGEGRLELLLAP